MTLLSPTHPTHNNSHSFSHASKHHLILTSAPIVISQTFFQSHFFSYHSHNIRTHYKQHIFGMYEAASTLLLFYFLTFCGKRLKVTSSMARASQWRIYYHRMWVQLSTSCSNFTEVAQWGAPSCSQPQTTTDNGIRDGRSNWLVAPPTLHRAVPPELHVLYTAMRAGLQITRLSALSQPRTCDLRYARPPHFLCGHSGYKYTPWSSGYIYPGLQDIWTVQYSELWRRQSFSKLQITKWRIVLVLSRKEFSAPFPQNTVPSYGSNDWRGVSFLILVGRIIPTLSSQVIFCCSERLVTECESMHDRVWYFWM